MKYFQRNDVKQQSLQFKYLTNQSDEPNQSESQQNYTLANYSSNIQEIHRRFMTLIHAQLIQKFYIQSLFRYTQNVPLIQRIMYLEQQYKLITNSQSNYHKIINIIQSRKNCIHRIRQSLEMESLNLNYSKILQTYCNSLAHLRIITLVLIQKIQDWRRQLVLLQLRIPKHLRVSIKKFPLIFWHQGQNVMQAIQYDTIFLRNTILKKYINFSKSNDPLLLYPLRLINSVGNHNRMKKFESVCRLFMLSHEMQTRLETAQKNLKEENQNIQNSNIKYQTHKKSFKKSNEFPFLFNKYKNHINSDSKQLNYSLIKGSSNGFKQISNRYKSQEKDQFKNQTKNLRNNFRYEQDCQPKRLLNQIRRKKVQFIGSGKSVISDRTQNSQSLQKNIINKQRISTLVQSIQYNKDYLIKEKKNPKYISRKLNRYQQSPQFMGKIRLQYQSQLRKRLENRIKTQNYIFQNEQSYQKFSNDKKYSRLILQKFKNISTQNDDYRKQYSEESINEMNGSEKQYSKQWQLYQKNNSDNITIIYKFDYQKHKLNSYLKQDQISKNQVKTNSFRYTQSSVLYTPNKIPVITIQSQNNKNTFSQSIQLIDQTTLNTRENESQSNKNNTTIKLEEPLIQQPQKSQKPKSKFSINSVDIPFTKFHNFVTFYGDIFLKQEIISIQKLINNKKFHHFYFNEVRQDGQTGAIAIGSVQIKDKVRCYYIYMFKYLQKTKTNLQKLLKCYLDYIWSFDPSNMILYLRNKYYVDTSIEGLLKNLGFKSMNINFDNQDLQNNVFYKQRMKKCRNLMIDKGFLNLQLTNMLMKINDRKILYSLEIENFSKQNYYSQYLLYHLLKFAIQKSNLQIKQQYMNISKFLKQNFKYKLNHKCYNFTNIEQMNQHLSSKEIQIYETKQKIQNVQLAQLLIYEHFNFDYLINKKQMIFETDNKWTFFGEDQQSEYVMIKLNKDFSQIFLLFYQQKLQKEPKKQNITLKKSMKSILKKINSTTFQQKKIIKIHFFKKQLYGRIVNIDNIFSLFGSMILSLNWTDFIKGIKIFDSKEQTINFYKQSTVSILIREQDAQLQCVFSTELKPQNFI